MSNQNENSRVLGRTGARTITAEEMEQVSGALRTGVCTFDPKTCVMDHDCEPPLGC